MGFWLLGLVTGTVGGLTGEFLDCQDFSRDFSVIEIKRIISVLRKNAACPFNKPHDLGMKSD